MIEKYARLLVDYSLNIQKNDKLLVRSNIIAEPLIKKVYEFALEKGAHVDLDLHFEGQSELFFDKADLDQLSFVSSIDKSRITDIDAYLYIRAPYNLFSNAGVDHVKQNLRSKAMQELQQIYMQRTGDLSLKRTLCQYPTNAAAQIAGMSLGQYQQFVYNACKLYSEDPVKAWIDVRNFQQNIVDFLNKKSKIHYKGQHIDLVFSTEGRKWINSDGQTNMPSGEVYTAPVDDSAQGTVTFSYTSVYKGEELKNVRLEFKDGFITKWDADTGKDTLDKIFEIEGARRLGEAAIGTNFEIDKITKNILFDEKIGGSVHLAIGQAYAQAGGKNQSPIHWDMITDMSEDGEIYADDELIYKNGKFII